MLQKCVYPYEYWIIGKNSVEYYYLKKKDFYSLLNMEDITDADNAHTKHFLYVQSNTLLLADVFEDSRNMCLGIYKPDPAKFLSAPGLVWQVALKKTELKVDLLTNIDMLLMVGKGIRGGICHSIYQYAKANNKYMKDYDKNKESSYIQCRDVNNIYGLAMPRKLPESNFGWIKDTFEFNEDFMKNYIEESDEGHFFKGNACNVGKVMYTEQLCEFDNDLLFLPERMKIEKVKNFGAW